MAIYSSHFRLYYHEKKWHKDHCNYRRRCSMQTVRVLVSWQEWQIKFHYLLTVTRLFERSFGVFNREEQTSSSEDEEEIIGFFFFADKPCKCWSSSLDSSILFVYKIADCLLGCRGVRQNSK